MKVLIEGIGKWRTENSMDHTQAKKLAGCAELLPDIIWTVEASGQISSSNQHWLQFAELNNPATIESQTFPPLSFIHPEDLPELERLWNIAQKTQGVLTTRLRLMRGIDSEYVWHQLRACPDAAAGNWLMIASDIHLLMVTQTMFQLVMDNIPISIFWKDRESRYMGCNRLFASDLGFTSTEELVGKDDYATASSKEECDFFRACDRRVIQSGLPEYHIIEPQLRASGKQAWLDTNKIPLRDAGGKVIGVLGMYEDITDRVTVEQQRDDFIATLTHDLKNPLLGTNRVLDLFLAGKLGAIDQRQLEIFSQVKDSNNSLIGMIQNLLDVYRYDSQTLPIENETIDLSDLLQSAVTRNAIGADEKEIQVALVIPGASAIIDGRRHSIDRVIQNLVDNALKFTPVKGRVDIKLTIDGLHSHVEIKDNGPGISLEEQKHLFNRFWQGTPGKKYTHGTGLGLYLCKQIVETHRGKITCYSVPEQGATFKVTLPIKSQSELQK